MEQRINPNQDVIRVHYDVKGYPYLETLTLAEAVEEAADDCKLFTDGCELRTRTWQGKSELLIEFDSPEEAEAALFEEQYYGYLDSERSLNDFATREEAIKEVAEHMELPEDVAESLIRRNETARRIESRMKAKQLMSAYYRAKEAAQGRVTKALRRARDNARWPQYFQWGLRTPFSSAELTPRDYYTDEFKAEIEKK